MRKLKWEALSRRFAKPCDGAFGGQAVLAPGEPGGGADLVNRGIEPEAPLVAADDRAEDDGAPNSAAPATILGAVTLAAVLLATGFALGVLLSGLLL